MALRVSNVETHFAALALALRECFYSQVREVPSPFQPWSSPGGENWRLQLK